MESDSPTIIYIDEVKDLPVVMFWLGGHKPTKSEPYATSGNGKYRVEIDTLDDGSHFYRGYCDGQLLDESADGRAVKAACVDHHSKNRRTK